MSSDNLSPLGVFRHLPCVLAALVLALSTGACQSVNAPPARADADSFLNECPWSESDTPADATTRAALVARFAAMGLAVRWRYEAAEPLPDQGDAGENRLAAIVLRSLECYPPGFFTRVGLREIALVRNLSVGGQLRRAMPVPPDTMVYSDNGGALCPAGMEVRVHHELRHFLDHRDDGDYYRVHPDWRALNPPGARYGRGGAIAYGTGFENLGHPASGFVSRYATFGEEEDRAETFGWMMTPGYAARVADWARADEALLRKREFIIAEMRRVSGGLMDAAYFENVAAGR